MDESHNTVVRYSVPTENEIDLGVRPILNSPAIKESEYCHAMIHRKEGEFLGELGMIGFSSCNFWFQQTGHHPLYDVVKTKVDII
jgi:hypothetical protein